MRTSTHVLGEYVLAPRVAPIGAKKSKTAEPVTLTFLTWEFVLEAFASGVLSWLGSKVMDSVFSGSSGISRATLVQLIETSIRNALRGIMAEQDMLVMKRNYEGVIDVMSDYNASGGVHRLDYADTTINSLIVGFRTYQDLTADLLVSAAALKICILQEYVKAELRDEQENIVRLATLYVPELEEAAETRHRNILGYYGNVVAIDLGPGEGVDFGYMYKEKFASVEWCATGEARCMHGARAKAIDQQNRDRTNEVTRRYTPIIKVLESMKAIVPA